ncbi:hypothetical protein ACFE04_016597 [Oxalis oulophora]
MAAYFTNSNNQRDAAPMIYLREPSMQNSYPDAPVIPNNMMIYMNSGSYPETLAGNSQQRNSCIEIQSMEDSESTSQQQEILSNLNGSRIGEHEFNAWRDGRNDTLVMQSAGIMQNLQGQGLSLSLGSQVPSGMQMAYNNPNQGFASLLSQVSEGANRNGNSRDEQSRNSEYGFSGGSQDSNKGELSPYGMSSIVRNIPNSRYLKVAQQLLDEVVNVRRVLKKNESEKNQNTNEDQSKSSKDGENGPQDSPNNSTVEISHGERQELQNKLNKLLSMLDEVDRRYKQYYHQMQIVVSSFDVIAGSGAAKPYTGLALQTISRHFRCLRDAITNQIKTVRKSLGEQDTSESKGVKITRLRYVDQQLRQQRALQQLGMMQQHAWRPQRGLPESSVSILRAWLFENFLHPYPKDSDKIMLARQTGLTRSQVSNWFINARVRLWKPMVEEMYKEEFADAELDSISSSENVVNATKGGDMEILEDNRRDDLQQIGSSFSNGPLIDSKPDQVLDIHMAGSTNLPNGESETGYGFLNRREEQRPGIDESNGFFPEAMGNDRFMAAAASAYHMSEMGRFGGGTGVSLTLGLQHCEGVNLHGNHHNFVPMREDDMYNNNPAVSSVVPETTAEFECINPGNRQQHRFSSAHLLHDFVA